MILYISRLYGVGKGVPLQQLITKNSMFLTAADVFLNRESATWEIVKAGEQAIVAVYGVRTNELNLDKFR